MAMRIPCFVDDGTNVLHVGTDEVLKRILPEGVEIPSSFEHVGHIAHFNLKDPCLPYKNIIGQVVLEVRTHISERRIALCVVFMSDIIAFDWPSRNIIRVFVQW
jgi:hypothetical protein